MDVEKQETRQMVDGVWMIGYYEKQMRGCFVKNDSGEIIGVTERLVDVFVPLRNEG